MARTMQTVLDKRATPTGAQFRDVLARVLDLAKHGGATSAEADVGSGSGLTVVESRYFFVWVAVVKWVIARVERIVRRAVEPARVPPALINSVALAVTRLEQRLWGERHPPLGSSAMIVARAPSPPAGSVAASGG